MLVIGPAHYDCAKNQAHQLREHLLNSTLYLENHAMLKKTTFLNVWGKCLGYKGWSDFQHASETLHASHDGKELVTPEQIQSLARSLCKSLYLHDKDEHEIERLLFCVATDHERSLFSKEDSDFYDIEPGSENNPISIELGPSRQILFLLEMMMESHGWKKEIPLAELTEILIKEAKNYRKDKGYSKTDAKIAGVDIYVNSGSKATDVISKAIDDGWINKVLSYENDSPEEVCRLTERGNWWLFTYHTESDVESWVKWNTDIDKTLSSSTRGRRIEDRFDRLRFYSLDRSSEEYIEFVLDEAEDKMSSYRASTLNSLINTIKSDIENYQIGEEVFHLYPRLFMSIAEFQGGVKADDLDLDVNLKFIDSEGATLSALDGFKFQMKTPFPNKRLIVGVGARGHNGIFVKVPKLASCIECQFVWIDTTRTRKTTHNQKFILKRHTGNSYFSVYGGEKNGSKIASWSFLDVFAIAGSAETQEQMETLNRFRTQIKTIRSEPNLDGWKRLTELSEEIEINAVSGGRTCYSLV